MRNIYYHNSEEVHFQQGESEGMEKALNDAKIEYFELPLLDDEIKVLRYQKDGVKKYAVIRYLNIPFESVANVYITKSVPEDGWRELAYDVDSQRQGEEPRAIKSRRDLAEEVARHRANIAVQKKEAKELEAHSDDLDWIADYILSQMHSAKHLDKWNEIFRMNMRNFGYDPEI